MVSSRLKTEVRLNALIEAHVELEIPHRSIEGRTEI
jgi:hypothetical protein